MRKILTSAQLRELDKMTISALDISSYELMERAVRKLFEHIKTIVGDLISRKFIVVAGTGNNGGDGLGIARMLRGRGADVTVWFCDFSQKITDECMINLDKIRDFVDIDFISLNDCNVHDLYAGDKKTIIIDAIFGTGLSRSVTGKYADVIDVINGSPAKVISIDIPSGLFADDNHENHGAIVKADITMSIQDYHLSSMFAENSIYYGKINVINIGHDASSLESIETEYSYLEREDISKLMKTRHDFDHKGTFGHALLVAGGLGKAGAAVLASRACLRCGVGLLSVTSPADICMIMQVSVPEAMYETNFVGDFGKYSAIGIGPGIGVGPLAEKYVDMVICSGKPFVADADALNLLSLKRGKIDKLTNCILTPHPKEFERLFGNFENPFARLKFMSDFSRNHNSVIVLKGGVTYISLTSGEIVMYNGRNPGIATGGSGDVLTGIIASLLAQGYSLNDAAQIGVWVHGEAGQYASMDNGHVSALASDIVDKLFPVFYDLECYDDIYVCAKHYEPPQPDETLIPF